MRSLALCLAFLAPLPAAAEATFHGNVARTGVYDSAGPRVLGGVKWTFKTGGPIVTSPIIAGNTVYVASLDGHLHAIDRETGAERWKFKSQAPIASSAAVEGDSLYFVSSMGSLAALDVETGKPRWVLPTEHERKFEAKGLHGLRPAAQTIPDAWDLFTSSPAVVEGIVYFGSGDGGIYAVDAKSGVLQWKVQTGDVVHTSPAYANGTLYVGSWDSRLYAIEAKSGRVLWTFEAGQDPVIHNQVGFQGSAAVVGGTVYVGCRDAHVYALDAATGHKKWDYPTSKSWVIATPAVRDGVVYVGTSDSTRFMALDAGTGRLLFHLDVKAYMFSSPALAGEMAYAGAHNGRLYAIDTKAGKIAWEFATEGSKADPLHMLDPEGRLREEFFAPLFGDFQDMYISYYRFVSVGGIVSSPAVADGVVYVGSMDGNLYALR